MLDNPIIDPYTIMSKLSYLSYAMGLTDKYETASLEKLIQVGLQQISAADYAGALATYNQVLRSIMQSSGNFNPYNYLQYTQSYPIDLTIFMNRYLSDFKLNPDLPFYDQNTTVFNNLIQEYMSNATIGSLEAMLSRHPTLILAGQLNLQTCAICIESALDQLTFTDSDTFKNLAFDPIFLSNGAVGGYTKMTGLT